MPVLTSEQLKRKSKRKKIRYAEYYDLQTVFDGLYAESLQGKVFNDLIGLITSEENIKLAYRTIKDNDGSKTAGVDRRTIKDLAVLSEEKFVALIQRQFKWYRPRAVRRVEIPKANGKMRPLGIPTIVDRIVQQCVLQVMEPICEAKFYTHSYGFRPNRSTENAISRCQNLMQLTGLHYAVDIDIKGFFDNVCHSKLIRQIWQMGIRDKKLLCIIKEMLKAPIALPNGETTYPQMGTPQGGILSPLLSNIVLNELDWWIASQWEAMPTHRKYKPGINKNGSEMRSAIYDALRKSRLKEMFIVRYADDFKIFCRSHDDAKCVFSAVGMWLKERLGLEISMEKSKIINLKQHYSEFLGFKMKVWKKGGKYVVRSHMSDKSKEKLKERLDKCIKNIQHTKNNRSQVLDLHHYNSVVIGAHNYYRIATNVNVDFSKIAYAMKRKIKNRIRKVSKAGTLENGFIKQRYGKSKEMRYLRGQPIVPIGYVQHKYAMSKKRSINRYTPEGRSEIHKSLKINMDILLWLMRNPVIYGSIEYADNRISLYAAQNGRCAVTGKLLLPHEIHCHHKKPLKHGGTDKYANLVIVSEIVHVLIHATAPETIARYTNELKIPRKSVDKLNKLRKQANLQEKSLSKIQAVTKCVNCV